MIQLFLSCISWQFSTWRNIYNALLSHPQANVMLKSLIMKKVGNGLEWKWAFKWTQSLRPHNKLELHNLQSLLLNVSLSPNDQDGLVWIPHKKGCFTVKSFNFELAKMDLNCSHKSHCDVWDGLVPYRVQIFVWLAI